MLHMSKHYELEFKNRIVRRHLENGRTLKSLADEYSVSYVSITNWINQFRKECQKNEEAKADYDFMKENLNLKKQLAKLQKAIESQPGIDLTKLLIHSDQGSQFTSKEYTEFCESHGIARSMSKAGYPYDNSPMERYFNTLKTDLIYQHHYRTEKELYAAIEEFAYVHYNHVRPHA